MYLEVNVKEMEMSVVPEITALLAHDLHVLVRGKLNYYVLSRISKTSYLLSLHAQQMC